MSHAKDVVLTAAAPLMFGSTYIVTTELLPPDRPLLTALIRALPAGLLLTAFSRRLPRGRWWWRSAVIGALNIAAFFALLFIAAYRLPGGVAAVVSAIGPLAVATMSYLFLSQRVAAANWGWGVLGVVGVAMVVLTGSAAFDGAGVAAGLAAVVSMSAALVLTKHWGRPGHAGPAALAGWQLTTGGLILLPIALTVEGGLPVLTTTNLVGFGYLIVFNTAIAYWLWFRGLARLPLVPMSFLGLLSPLAAVVLGWWFAGEGLTWWQSAGMVLAVAATVAAQLAGRSRRRRVTPAPVAAGATA